ncbi:tail fiber protein [uncultured phage cr53_1]|uniref:Tail fiber protein n=1 Tax=uncultured phage cr53_1 TaxID=2772080 RepID=A0A7M1RRI2_9CAUD|nr:tail fiber protein [uncultured phage cr53_1]QOR56744.1 tail fiber protein [uncultured phage cr53_1]
MIARIKGLKISQASERTVVTGLEMIPFQDGERNGKIRMIEFKDMTMYIFDPTIVDGKVSQEDYDALKQAIEEGKLIYTINSNRNGLDLATEVAIVGGTIYIESPDFIKEEGTDNISQVVFDTITVDGSLNYSKEQYTTTVIKTTGDGTKVLTDNGQYVYIGNLALTNIKFKDGTNTSTYDLVTNGITFRQNSTPCVSWNTVKSGNNIYMDIRIANATASMDGLMSKEDYVELNTTIPGQIEDLKEADSNINNRIDDLDDKIDKEIADREAEIDRIENKFDGVTDKLEDALQKEIEDRKAGDTTITNSLNAFISTKGQPSGLAELDSTGKVPAAQLPSYVDDVLEFSTKAQFPLTGETGKIYVAKDTNLTYRWTGTQYLEISLSLALGETPSTAYSGDKGKANRDALNSMPTKITSYLTPTTSTGELVKINYKYAAKDGLNYGPLQDDNIDIPSATTTNAGAMSAIDKGRLDSLYNEFGSIQNPGDKLDSLPNNLVTGMDVTSRNATSVTINYKQSDLSAASNSYANPITKSLTIPAATQSAAGVMTATDKLNLDVNIPNRITNLDNRVTTEVDRLEELIESSSSEITNDLNVEIQARKDGDNLLQTNINNLLSTMNTELAKKVGKVTVAGSGNAVTTASISGDTLTLTKGATYNNYVHPAGSAPSKASGFYKFSTDSTSHVASVTAVTKADITALGIPALNTNTTYTFANGSAGNFTVTPSGGSALTVSVGKPANAGNADTVGGISPSDFVKKAGDTMTGNLNFDNNTGIITTITADGSHIVKIGSAITGGWARGYNFFNNNSGAALAAIGCLGGGQTLSYAYIGNTYENTWQRWNSSGSVITVPLTTAAITSSGVVKTTLEMIAKYLRFEKDGANVGYIGAGSTANNDIYILSQNDNSIHFCVSGYSTSAGMTVHTNSNVSIGGDAATEKLNVAGNITSTGKVSAANGFFKESDARLKSDIKPLDYTLDLICSIPTVSFIMNDLKQIGTIALDLEELGFECIVTESDALKSEVKNPEQFESFTKDGEEYVKVKKVEYEMLGVLAIEGVKMLKDEIEKLKAEIETLKNKQHE